jgi:hypothetical protein
MRSHYAARPSGKSLAFAAWDKGGTIEEGRIAGGLSKRTARNYRDEWRAGQDVGKVRR